MLDVILVIPTVIFGTLVTALLLPLPTQIIPTAMWLVDSLQLCLRLTIPTALTTAMQPTEPKVQHQLRPIATILLCLHQRQLHHLALLLPAWILVVVLRLPTPVYMLRHIVSTTVTEIQSTLEMRGAQTVIPMLTQQIQMLSMALF